MDGINGAPFSSILQKIEHGLANGSQTQPRKCEQKTRQWCARHGFLIWFKFSNGQEGAKAFKLGGGNSNIFYFHRYLGSFMIQFDDVLHIFADGLVKNHQVVYEIIPV